MLVPAKDEHLNSHNTYNIMPTVKRSYVYFTCIECEKTRYKTVKQYQKMLEKQTPAEIDATFKCGPCKRATEASSTPSEA